MSQVIKENYAKIVKILKILSDAVLEQSSYNFFWWSDAWKSLTLVLFSKKILKSFHESVLALN